MSFVPGKPEKSKAILTIGRIQLLVPDKRDAYKLMELLEDAVVINSVSYNFDNGYKRDSNQTKQVEILNTFEVSDA